MGSSDRDAHKVLLRAERRQDPASNRAPFRAVMERPIQRNGKGNFNVSGSGHARLGLAQAVAQKFEIHP